MTNISAQQSIPQPIVRQAIAWRIRLGAEDASERDLLACRHWRNSDPQHERAWLRLEQAESGLRIVAERAPRLAQAAIHQTDAECRRIGRRKALKLIGNSALGLGGLALLAGQQDVWQQINADYNTGSHRQAFTLQDNSRLWLNKDTSIGLDFSASTRSLALTRGEVYVQTAADQRPLQLQLAQGKLQTEDATFMVRHHFDSASDAALVQVQQGSVQVLATGGAIIHSLRAGDTIHLAQDGLTSIIDGQRFDYSSWIDGLLVARGMPLEQFSAELQRYHPGLIRIDKALKQHPVSGVFQLQDTHLILQLLARSANAKLQYRSPWWAEIRPQNLA